MIDTLCSVLGELINIPKSAPVRFWKAGDSNIMGCFLLVLVWYRKQYWLLFRPSQGKNAVLEPISYRLSHSDHFPFMHIDYMTIWLIPLVCHSPYKQQSRAAGNSIDFNSTLCILRVIKSTKISASPILTGGWFGMWDYFMQIRMWNDIESLNHSKLFDFSQARSFYSHEFCKTVAG